uniref:ARAD1C24156p n=1 Tax=Blastobotrys adeninivorans TaxID=409370 RepID=A0A060T2C2_BLAAD
MDPFADLGRPSGSSSARSGTPVSRNGTPKLGDSFADLASLAGARGTARNNVNSMTLEQRQKLNAENKSSSSSSSVAGANNQPDSWADLDLLSGGIKVSAPTESMPTANVNSNSNGGQDDNIDELFDVFNRPPPAPTRAPPPSQQSPAIPSSSSRTSASAQQSPRSNSPSQSPESPPSSPKASKSSRGDDPRDGKIAELVEMGFSVEQSKRALANTDTGLDVRQAIDFLMREAHEKSRGNSSAESTRPSSRQSSRPQRAQQGTPPAPDLGKLAQDFSAQFISKAGSFWNQSRKNIARAIEQYNTGPANDGTPAWMRDRERYLNMEAAAQREREKGPVTEEAATLESHERQRSRKAYEDKEMPQFPTSRARTESPAWMDSNNGHNNGQSDKQPTSRTRSEQRNAASRAPEPTPSSSGPNRAETKPVGLARTRGFKFNDEEETYISPARRKGRPDSKPASPAPPPPPPAAQVKPKQPKVSRAPVEISPAASQAAQSARTSGNESFKRGDFSEAATNYGLALKHIPPKHLSRTIVLSNRATCFMKLGDNKAALADAEEGIVLIGQSFGEGEEAEPGKSLKDIWAKLVTRKAEASEQLEKFSDALTAWTLLLNNGFSSKTSIEGKRRCKEALDPKPKSATPSKVPSRMPSRTQTPSQASQEALNRVRQANQAAEKADAEKYQLLDSVDARINGWKDGKEDNIRALLASLDTVLWPELEWKTISMAELLVPKKVKIAYMKAAAKTHPDKISTDTETEKKMIAQGVFVALNRAWESFKQENNMS